MKQVLFFSLFFLVMACSVKKNPEDVTKQLKVAMTGYLNNDPHAKSKYSYDVKSVSFFEETNFFICEFQVRMTNEKDSQASRKIDTTGVMKVKMDKNFKVISRYY